MAKTYYAVRRGRITGIFYDWEVCKQQVHKFPGAEFKSFKTMEECVLYLYGEKENAKTEVFTDTEPVDVPF